MSKRRRDYGSGSLWTEPRANGREVYACQFSIAGRQYQRVLGTVRKAHAKDGLTRAQAEKALRSARAGAEQDSARDSDAGQGPPHKLTLCEVADLHLRWLEGKGRKQSTIDGYREMIDLHLRGFFGTRPVRDITHRDVEGFIDHLRAIGRKNGTIANYTNLLHAILGTALRRGYVRENAVSRADNRPSAGADDDGVLRYLRMEDIEAMLRAIPDDHLGPTDRALYLTATMTGLRMGELRALRWRNVDFVAQVLRVEQSFADGRLTRPKSRRSERAVPMPTRVAQALARHAQRSHYAADDDLVFPHPHRGGYLSDSTIRDRFKKACAAAGVRRVRFHDLRHTYGTLMAGAGVPLRVLQGLMGHASYATTEKYAKWAPNATAELAFAERAFAGQAGDRMPIVG